MEKKNVLVCIGSASTAEKLIKIVSRLSVSHHEGLIAVHVRDRHCRREDEQSLNENLEYARKMNAETKILDGGSPAALVAEFARKENADIIVLGRSNEKGPFASLFYKRLCRLIPEADIMTIPQPQPEYDPSYHDNPLRTSWKDISVMLGILSLATLLSWQFHLWGFTDATLITVYILAVLLISFLTTGYVCSSISSVLSVLIFNFLFTVPLFSLQSYGTGYPVTLVIMFLSAFLTSSLTAQVKRQAQQHAQNAYRTEMLLNANRRLQMAIGETEIMQETARQIQKLLVRSVLIYPVYNGILKQHLDVPAGEDSEDLKKDAETSSEQTVARWVVENNTQAGAGTGVYDDSAFWYLAVRLNDNEICAVAAIRVDPGEGIDAFDKNLLLAILSECAVAIEKERLNQQNEEYVLQMRQEHFRSDLLRSISHDLRTPLTTISGNASLLLDNTVKNEADKRAVYSDIYEDSIWLIGLVENLLSITRMDDGSVNMNLEAQDLSDIIDAAVSHEKPRLKLASVTIDKGTDLAIVNGDSSLLVQLLVNLIDNAVKYAGDRCHIWIRL